MPWRRQTRILFVLVVVFVPLAAIAAIHTLKGTFIDSISGTSVAIPAATLTAIGNVVAVSCPGTSGTCTIAADMWAQAGGASTAANHFELCLFVDGVRVDPGCFGYAGTIPADSSYLVGASSQSLSGVAPGNHTVQAYFWAANGCNVGYRHFTYTVYKP